MLQAEYQKNPPDFDELITLSQFFAADLFAFKESPFSPEQEVRISRMIRRDETVSHGYRDVGGHGRERAPVEPRPLAKRTSASGDCLYIELALNLGGTQGIRSIGLGPRCSTEVESEMSAVISGTVPDVMLWRSDVRVEEA